ncbi:hypothetical protein CMUS01_12464 [Colletotrichum musicola]|uniref:Uncharacterized protein n=1 Tax=Colletotrichum musicola TaxID=2175873 RepID=A0A8H6N0X3_9PEZI|nr:hypothetical protein CMUS01_12464 [Colletotrichum musicola]
MRAWAVSSPNVVGHAVLFEVQRKEADVKPARPFDSRLEDDIWARYKELWDKFEQAAEDLRILQAEREHAGLDMLIGMLDHQLKRGHYENALISALAVMGIREDGGWVQITDYTNKYSAVIKVARMLVVYQAVVEQREEMAVLEREMGKDEAEDKTTSLFQHVRSKVQRFMTRTSGAKDAEPTPMDWILETRTYGMHIQYNTAVASVIDWVGERVSYWRVRFTIGQLSDALYELVRETRGLLGEATLTSTPDREGWSAIEDDHSETKVGYSFLSDDRNNWWGIEGDSIGSQFDERAVRDYGHTFEQLRERLWMLLHILGGQPGRATELGGLRTVNTTNGGVRNIFVHDKIVCFVTAYHKGYRTTGQAKVIHQYLPREVGELLVWYLWLVLPFWQEVQGITREVGKYSSFLWADETVQEGAKAGDDRDSRDGREEAARDNEDDQVGEWT